MITRRSCSTWQNPFAILMRPLGSFLSARDMRGRTLKTILRDNALLHPLAEDSFPDRQGLGAILRGTHKSNELVRKTLILLNFYEYWTALLLRKDEGDYEASSRDAERCFTQINRYLVDAGYPTLYAGNPYDWIFLYAMQDKYPMETFRFFMRELYIIKEDEIRCQEDAVTKPFPKKDVVE